MTDGRRTLGISILLWSSSRSMNLSCFTFVFTGGFFIHIKLNIRLARETYIIYLSLNVTYIFHCPPSREEFIKCMRLKTISWQNMRTYLRSFLNQANTNWFAELLLQLFETNCCGETRWTSTNNHNIIFHLFTFYTISVLDSSESKPPTILEQFRYLVCKSRCSFAYHLQWYILLFLYFYIIYLNDEHNLSNYIVFHSYHNLFQG